MRDIPENKAGNLMVVIDTNTAWWGQTNYRVDGAFDPGDQMVRILDGEDPDEFFMEKYPTGFDGEQYNKVKLIGRRDTNETIADVGGQTAIIQPSRFISFAKQILKDTDLKASTLLFTDNCRRLAMTMLLDSDKYKQSFASIGTSCDNSRALYATGWDNKIVCSNTETAAYGFGKKVTCKHTDNWEQNIPNFIKFLEELEKHREWADAFEEALKEIKIETQDRKDFIMDLMPDTWEEGTKPSDRQKTILFNKRNNLSLMCKGVGRSEFTGTAIDLYNGVTEYSSHPSRKVKGSVDKNKFNSRTEFATQATGDGDNAMESHAVAYLGEKYELA